MPMALSGMQRHSLTAQYHCRLGKSDKEVREAMKAVYGYLQDCEITDCIAIARNQIRLCDAFVNAKDDEPLSNYWHNEGK